MSQLRFFLAALQRHFLDWHKYVPRLNKLITILNILLSIFLFAGIILFNPTPEIEFLNKLFGSINLFFKVSPFGNLYFVTIFGLLYLTIYNEKNLAKDNQFRWLTAQQLLILIFQFLMIFPSDLKF